MATPSIVVLQFSHDLLFFVFLERYCSCCSPSIAVFYQANAFNQDVSKWNTGAVTTMYFSKCTLSPSLWPRHPFCCWVFEIYDNSRVLHDLNSHTFCCFRCFCCFWNGTFCCGLLSSFFLLYPLLQCLVPHLCSIMTCQNGIRARLQVCLAVSVLSLPLCGHAIHSVVFSLIRQLENHLISILTKVLLFLLFSEPLLSGVGVCGLFILSLFVAPSFAVFWRAYMFNQDVSTWNTGAVTSMSSSKCNLSPLCAASSLCFSYDNSRFV